MPIVTLSLLLILLILIILGVFESRMHQIALSKIPIRIHINGTRGKSSVTRLIAAGLRSHGIKTFAKTTGSSGSRPVFFETVVKKADNWA